ncbi:MAG TPA: hypothetical protein VGG33_01810 [Polyangia bacterium]
MQSLHKTIGIVIPLLIAIAWGYFRDLQQGDYGAFILRLVFVTGVAVGIQYLLKRRRRPERL